MASATINGPPCMYHARGRLCKWSTMHGPQDSPRFPKIPLSDLYAKPSGGPGPPPPLVFCFCFPLPTRPLQIARPPTLREIKSDRPRSWKLVLSTGNGLHHVGVGCKTSMIFNMPRDANDEGHSTGWLGSRFCYVATARHPQRSASPCISARRTSPVYHRLRRRASHEEVDASAAALHRLHGGAAV